MLNIFLEIYGLDYRIVSQGDNKMHPRRSFIIICPRCDGTGYDFCPSCGNETYKGTISVVLNEVGEFQQCLTCGGMGYDSHSQCPACDGIGYVLKRAARHIQKHVPLQIKQKQELADTGYFMKKVNISRLAQLVDIKS